MSKVYQKGRKTVHRGLHALQPTRVTDAITGDEVDLTIALNETRDLMSLMNNEIGACLNDSAWVERFTMTLNDYHAKHGKNPSSTNARKWASDNNLLININAPKSWQSSRLKEMATRKVITEYGGWLANDSQGKDKGDFKLGQTFNPAFTDNQFSTIQCDMEHHTVVLRMQVGARKLDFHFRLPERQLESLDSIIGIVKPVVRETSTGDIVFDFKLKLEVPLLNKTGCRAGLDLGVIEPYMLTIINDDGQVMARYHASKACYQVMGLLGNAESELRLLRKAKHRKVQAYKALSITLEEQEDFRGFHGLCLEVKRLASRVSRLKEHLASLISHEVRCHLALYGVRSLGVEYLGWLAGHKGQQARNKSWAYGECQSALTSQLELIGVRVKRVPARDTSQSCNHCGSRVRHYHRTCYCPNKCLTEHGWDRDLNASVNIALRL